ncbi:hypothetical protein [Psychrobacillus vulpis]|uniref:Lipoprotein n=1 Tax=Psychrobacillus vulpis TaxID=2325572 RepID=A0A544TJ99_9BACI|nr:hypothetical protein [Psychrobacillus vulpis]TQR17537.1 hypothetical protein FG384_17725 [Psychrobacillus vulpis]
MKFRLVFFAIVFSLLWLMGCSNNMDGGEKKDVENGNEFPPSMTGIIKASNKEYEMKSGNYRWERKQGSNTEVVQTDAASPYQLAEQFNAIMLEQNTNINIEIEGNPNISVYLWNENGRDKEVTLTSNQLSAANSKGRYVYEVLAKWSNGEVSYTFVVEIR